MKIKAIKIEKLFDIFDYNIAYKTNENVLVITGPNGFGKTTILNIIFSVFNDDKEFLRQLLFDKITLFLEYDMSIEIVRYHKEGVSIPQLRYTVCEKGQKVENFDHNFQPSEELIEYFKNDPNIEETGEKSWETPGRIAAITKYLVRKYFYVIPEKILEPILKSSHIYESLAVYMIKEQRLLKKVKRKEDDQIIVAETIKEHVKKLTQKFTQKTEILSYISQQLDTSYPSRLISEKRKISKEEYDKKFESLRNKQEQLVKYGIYDKVQEQLEYSPEDAKALLVYLDDLDQKLGIYDDLLKKLNLFTTILNERRFTFKTIEIHKDKGFYFQTSTGKILELNDLSSGEQHEVVLLFELIFNTTPNMLVLIDEPEMSLHVTWQKEFIKDLLKIIELQQFQVLIATHSPSIINDRWDLVHNLKKVEA